MTTAEGASLKSALTTILSSYTANYPITNYIRQWRDDVDGCTLGYNGRIEEVAGRDPGGVLVCTVAALPPAAGNNTVEAIVTDSTVATNGGTVVGGGATRVLVRSNNTNWLIV